MKCLLALIVLVSTGCSTQAAVGIGVGAGAVISLEFCEKVKYERDGVAVKLYAECRAPLR